MRRGVRGRTAAFAGMVVFAGTGVIALTLWTASARPGGRSANAALALFAALMLLWLLRERSRGQAGRVDAVTGVLSRGAFMHLVERRTAREDHNALLLLISLDNHAEVVQRFGEAVGDVLLASLARRLHDSIPGHHGIGRVGAARFALLCDAMDDQEWTRFQRHLGPQLRAPQRVDDVPLLMEVRWGVAHFPSDGLDAGRLLEAASVMLAQARAWRPAPPARRSGAKANHGSAAIELVSELEAAVEHGDLYLLYQPVLELGAQGVLGAEALVRWRHPRRGVIAPAAFVPIAEQTGAIRAVTGLVVEHAVSLLSRWNNAGLSLHLSINVSARDLADDCFAGQLNDALHGMRVPPERLEIELTEHAMSRDWETSRRVLNSIRETGVGIAVDDFGTGYSSLTHLKDLRVDTLKLDRSFVRELGSSSQTLAIVRAVMGLAEGLDARTLAEGIERADVAQVLTNMGCQAGQGYYFAPPMDEQHLTEWIRERGMASAVGL